jgi:hypothetical protein
VRQRLVERPPLAARGHLAFEVGKRAGLLALVEAAPRGAHQLFEANRHQARASSLVLLT